MSSTNALSEPEKKPTAKGSLKLFEGYGIELEYMLVDHASLDTAPVLDKIFRNITGKNASDILRGDVEISNELVSHVAEFKCAQPEADLKHLCKRLAEEVKYFNKEAATLGVKLMPGGMHAWMNPEKEMKLWEGEYNEVYESYNKIFGCSGHGWSNLQSVHINFPFSGEEEFGRLHAAIRVVLPLIPALAASSPFTDGNYTGHYDNRLNVYRQNQAKVPEICGRVIPEPCFTFENYRSEILENMFRAIGPHDEKQVLQEEWLNSRGAIARFDRNAIEIRLVDSQESVLADLSVAFLIIETVKMLVNNQLSTSSEQREADQDTLVNVLNRTITEADHAEITETAFLRLFGIPAKKIKAGEVWQNIFKRLVFSGNDAGWKEPLSLILEQGTLAGRILKACGPERSRQTQKEVYARLCDCLENNLIFIP